MTKKERKVAAYEALEANGTIRISYDDGIECEDELIEIGVNMDLVHGCLHQIDYYACSIKYDGEYHHGKDLDKEDNKLRRHLDRFGIDYEID